MGTTLALPQLSVPRSCARSSSTFQSDLHGHPERSCEGKRMTEGWCQSQQTQAGCGLRKWGGEAANVPGAAWATRAFGSWTSFFLINKNSHFLCSDFPSWVPTQNVLSPRVPLACDSFSDCWFWAPWHLRGTLSLSLYTCCRRNPPEDGNSCSFHRHLEFHKQRLAVV